MSITIKLLLIALSTKTKTINHDRGRIIFHERGRGKRTSFPWDRRVYNFKLHCVFLLSANMWNGVVLLECRFNLTIQISFSAAAAVCSRLLITASLNSQGPDQSSIVVEKLHLKRGKYNLFGFVLSALCSPRHIHVILFTIKQNWLVVE